MKLYHYELTNFTQSKVMMLAGKSEIVQKFFLLILEDFLQIILEVDEKNLE